MPELITFIIAYVITFIYVKWSVNQSYKAGGFQENLAIAVLSLGTIFTIVITHLLFSGDTKCPKCKRRLTIENRFEVPVYGDKYYICECGRKTLI